MLPLNDERDNFLLLPYLERTFEDVISLIHQKRIDPISCFFYLLQLIRILEDLERNNKTHGNICPTMLRNRIPKNSILTDFDDGPTWNETGLVLVECDKLDNFMPGIDRIAVANLFAFIVTKSNSKALPVEIPGWKKYATIWDKIFTLLDSTVPLNELENEIIQILMKNQNPKLLKKLISDYNCDLIKSN